MIKLQILSGFILISSYIFSLVYTHAINFKHDISYNKRDDDDSLYYYYNQLHSNEKKIYDNLKKQIEKALEKGYGLYDFDIYDISIYEESNASHVGFRATSAFVMDNPKYFWIGHGNEQKIATLGNYIKEMHISFKNTYSEDDIISYYNQINDIIAPVVETINGISTVCEKLQYIHDYLVKLIVYKYDQDYSRYNIHGALVDHESVCEGYAEAFTYICQLAGIPSIIVNSKTHEWNFVKMDDGQWYAMDITYDDPKIGNMEFKSGDDRNKKYDYFLIGKNTEIITDNKRMPYNESPDHQLLDYLLVESSTGFEFPDISDEAYKCPINMKTNYIQDYYIPNKQLYIYVIIGIIILFVGSLILSCIKGARQGRLRKNRYPSNF